MLKNLIRTGVAITALAAAGQASAVVITAQGAWDGLSTVTTSGVKISACTTSGSGSCSAGRIGYRSIPTVGDGIGVQGNGNNEIDWYAAGNLGSEMLRFNFDTASVIDSLQLGLLFDGPEYNDFQESAVFRVTYGNNAVSTYTLSTLFAGSPSASWSGPYGSWSGAGLGNGQSGLWTGTNPFGSQGVKQIDMFAARGTCGTGTCTDQSDYVFRSMTATSVPEPGTLALMAAGLLGVALAGRRRALPAKTA